MSVTVLESQCDHVRHPAIYPMSWIDFNPLDRCCRGLRSVAAVPKSERLWVNSEPDSPKRNISCRNDGEMLQPETMCQNVFRCSSWWSWCFDSSENANEMQVWEKSPSNKLEIRCVVRRRQDKNWS
jgi:hypothetical protein